MLDTPSQLQWAPTPAQARRAQTPPGEGPGRGRRGAVPLCPSPAAPHKPVAGRKGLGVRSVRGQPPGHSAGRQEVRVCGEQTSQGRPPGRWGHQAEGHSGSSWLVTGWNFLLFLLPIPRGASGLGRPRAPRDPRLSRGAQGWSAHRERERGLSLVTVLPAAPQPPAPLVSHVEPALLRSRSEGLGGCPHSRPPPQPSPPLPSPSLHEHWCRREARPAPPPAAKSRGPGRTAEAEDRSVLRPGHRC